MPTPRVSSRLRNRQIPGFRPSRSRARRAALKGKKILMLKLTDEKLLRRDAYIDGAWVGAPARFKVDDPATGDVLAEVADLGEAETRAAIERAHAAFPAWATK